MQTDDSPVSPASAAGLVSDLLSAAPDAPRSQDQLDAAELARAQASRDLYRMARSADNDRRWFSACPTALQATNWEDPRIAPFSPQIEAVLNYKLHDKGILASGPTGRAKSRAMWALMRRLGREGHDVRLWTSAQWFTQLQRQIVYGRDDAEGWVEATARRHIVFFDDIGQEAVHLAREQWAASWFFRFLDIRVGESLPFFATTNLSADLMAANGTKVRADPLIRRLLDICHPIPFETEPERILRLKPHVSA